MPTTPSIFISYARSDGEDFADEFCKRLKRDEPELKFWRDRYEMEGGKDWWNQITASLDQVQFAVLVMTPAAMKSQACRAEWRYARAQGVCVYPVKGAPDDQLKIEKLPRWMSRSHFYDLAKEWDAFVNHLKGRCEEERVPFMAPELPTDHVKRPAEIESLLDCVRDAAENSIAGTTAIYGAGGFGKTTLAAALCHDDDVLTGFSNGVLWVTLGQNPDIKGGLTKLYAALTGERPAFVDVEDAATELAGRIKDKNCLLVVDDVWDETHLRPFLRGGKDRSYLVTTRNREIAAEADRRLAVAKMTSDEAVQMLTGRLEMKPLEVQPFRNLASRLGKWPLLLRLAASTLRQRLQRGDTVEGALGYLDQSLDKRGFTVFDHRNPKARDQAVAMTMGVSLDQLKDSERDRYFELSTFPDDTDVPLSAVGVLLGTDDFETQELVDRLDDLSLLELDLRFRSLRLHDVIRAFLGQHMTESGHALEATFVIRSALAHETLRHEQRRPETVFELAREGKLNTAERTLAIIEADPTWWQIAILTSAWLAAPMAPAEARALRDRIAPEVKDPQAQLLLQRLQSLPDDHPPLDVNLPPAPDELMVNQILERLGGGGVTGIEPLNLEGLGDEAPAYLAEQDGPFLVAFAAADPEHHTAPLRRYIAMLGSNEYEYYRNRSLGILLNPVLAFPDPTWVQERLIDLITQALSGRRVDFREAVPATATFQLARAGLGDAIAELDLMTKKTMEESENLSPDRGQGDPWGHCIRRLAVLAEGYQVLLDAGAETSALLEIALALPYGFAGFRAQACLTLAEAIRICHSDDADAMERALTAAMHAAQNIQDQTFCALSTARVHAMRRRWWTDPFDVAEAARRLAEQPGAPEFCPTHQVGETYPYRDRGPMKMPSPDEMFAMNTLGDLAQVYRCSEKDLVRLNQEQGWDATTVLPDGAAVNIPDPDFPPLLAARLAAEALVVLPEEKRDDTLRTLLRIAQSDATATNTVAARFMLTDSTATPEAVGRLATAARIQAKWLSLADGEPRRGWE